MNFANSLGFVQDMTARWVETTTEHMIIQMRKLIRGSSSASSKLRPWASIDVVIQLDAGKDFQ